MDLSPAEIRVLGCLLEKQRTTPDTYPLTLNALRSACNQSTNRDPVVAYDEATIRDAITRLNRRRWARLSSGAGSRTSKYRHLLDESLTRAPDELAVLCVLMLRGAQTPGELKGRTDRLHPFADLAAVHATLDRLIERDARRAAAAPAGAEGGALRAPPVRRRRAGGDLRGAGAADAGRGPIRRPPCPQSRRRAARCRPRPRRHRASSCRSPTASRAWRTRSRSCARSCARCAGGSHRRLVG